MKTLIRETTLALVYITVGANAGALMWYAFIEDNISGLTGWDLITPLIFLPISNTFGVLMCWPFYHQFESALILIGMTGFFITLILYRRLGRQLRLMLLSIFSGLYSIKAIMSFHAMMSV